MVTTCAGHDSGGSLSSMTLTIRVGLSHMTHTADCTFMTCLGCFPGSGLLSLTRNDLYETGLTVYKDTVLGDLFPKLLLKHYILNLARLVILICLFLFIFFKIDASDL